VSFANAHERKKAAARAEGRGHIIDAHAHTVRNRGDLEKSETAGCFYCCETFAPSEIMDWIDNDDCALCPRCGIDSVIPGASGFPVSDRLFLQEMNKFWF
jgi:hypothetical protein